MQLQFLQLVLEVLDICKDACHAKVVLFNVLVFNLQKAKAKNMRYAEQPHIEEVADLLRAWFYLFEEIHFPGTESFNQLSLSVLELFQAVIMAGRQFLHQSFSTCEPLHRGNGKDNDDECHLTRSC